MWIGVSKWENDVKILMFHVNAHHKLTSAEDQFNNEVDRMTNSLDNDPLSLAIPVFVQ